MQTFQRLGSVLLGFLLLVTTAFAAAPVVQHSDSVGVTLGDAVAYHVVATGTVNTFSAQGLPNGVSIDPATGFVSGTPTDVGTYRATVFASNNDGSASMVLAIAVVAPDAAPLIYAPLEFDAYNTPERGGDMFTCALKATGSLTSFDVTDPLPAGWSFSSGTIVGRTTTAGLFLVPVHATNAYGTGSSAVTVRVHPACTQLQQTTGTLRVGDVFTVTLQFSRPASFSGAAPYLEFHTYPNGATRRIAYVSGNGTATFVFSYTVSPSDAPGDILLYKTIQPAVGANVDGLVDQDGMALGSALPISGAVTASATIAATSPAPAPSTGATASTTTSGSSTTVASSPSAATSTTATPSSAVTATGATSGTPAVSAASTSVTSTTSTSAATSSGTRLVNLSARGLVADGNASHAFIAGFVVSGTAPKQMLIRAVGPSLAPFGVQNPLPNPLLRVYDGSGNIVVENDDWSGGDVAATAAAVGAFSLPAGSRDSAVKVTLPPGNYSIQVLPNGGTGIALAEVYDADGQSTGARLINISTRGYVAPGEAVLTAGFVIDGSTPKRLLIRGVGPALAHFNVPGVLVDPNVKIYQGNTIVAQNDDWQVAQAGSNPDDVVAAAKAAGAFAFDAGSHDAAVIVTLAPGTYTAAVSGATGTSGAAMVEVYELQ